MLSLDSKAKHIPLEFTALHNLKDANNNSFCLRH